MLGSTGTRELRESTRLATTCSKASVSKYSAPLDELIQHQRYFSCTCIHQHLGGNSFVAVKSSLSDCTTLWIFSAYYRHCAKAQEVPSSQPCKENRPNVLCANHDEGKLLSRSHPVMRRCEIYNCGAPLGHSGRTFAEMDVFLLEHPDTMSGHWRNPRQVSYK